MWTARSGQMVANILATDVKKMLKALYLLDYEAECFVRVILKPRIKLLLYAEHNSGLY